MSFEKMMQQLKEDYIGGLPSKIAEIESRLKPEHIDELREDFHKLKGTGKTYGLPEISQLAEAVEKICIHQPDKAVEASIEGIQLLKKIHLQRVQSQAVNLTQDEGFRKIQQLAA